MNELRIDGNANLNGNVIPFHFENHILSLYYERFSTENTTLDASQEGGEGFIRVRERAKLSGGWYLMHACPSKPAPFPHTFRREVDWFIDSFDSRAKYHEMKFHFDELIYFMPSSSKVSKPDEKHIVFDTTFDVESEFDLQVNDKTVKVRLGTYSDGECGPFSKAVASTISEIDISFEAVDDYVFFYRLYCIIRDMFCFICNRKNITLESAELYGLYEVQDEKHPVVSELHVYDKYKEPTEENKIIARTATFECFKSCFDKLMRLVADNYNRDEGTISIRGIHMSTRQRNLIDLRQYINITSAFEHHVRKYMPEISSKETIEVYDEIKKLIEQNYLLTAAGKKKKVAKEIVKHLRPTISLGDKIRKCVKGYDNWESLELVVNERFPDWDNLARIANEWRNELAHEKREANPTVDTIRAVRLVEHLNYAIILRTAGYADTEIKQIVEKVLAV